MAAPRPGNPDRGWNDPPMFNYSPKTSGQLSPRGHKLNKRIAYTGGAVSPSANTKGTGALLNPETGPPTSPVQLLPPITLLPPATSTTPSASVPLLIPTMGPVIPLKPPAESSGKAANAQGDIMAAVLKKLNISSDDELFDKVKRRLDAEFERCLPRLQGRSAEDIRRKLQVLKENWSDKKLCEDVRVRIWNVLQALENTAYDEAWEIHLSLMVDYTAEVGQWLVAVKRLIHESREMKKEKDRSCTEQTETDLDTSGATINMIKMLDVEAITTDAEQQEVDAESGADVVDAEGGDDVDVIDAESGADIDAGSSVDG